MPLAAELHGTEVILVVDDEEPVRSLMCRTLRSLGYFVLEAADGEDALAVLQAHHAPAHVVITDLAMPGLGGAPLVEMLHAWYPAIKVLFVSGHSEESAASQGAFATGARFLAKPFGAETLARMVRNVIDD
jgi:two-component system cell cycle sensor histidine kinase/response regulator CckA